MTQELPVTFAPIGIVKNSFAEPSDPKTIRNSASTLIIYEKYLEALAGLENFRHILVVFYFHKSRGYDMKVHPMGDKSIPKRGLFATRTPMRPNPLGVTVVEVQEIMGNKIIVTGLDALNESPILDIKPYEEHFDTPAGVEAERYPDYSPSDG